MSSFAVTAERLTIHPHDNADALELAQVGGYRAVVAKGRYRTGDLAVYIPEQAIVPDELIAELGLEGRLAGKAKNRVKAVRLRGELSQGIVCLPAATSEVDLGSAERERTDLASLLGVTKWVPEVPAHMSGEVAPAPDALRWIDIENHKRFPDVFHPGERVTATEKLHGSCCAVTVMLGSTAADDEVLVSSKGFNTKGLALVESESNLYWRAVHHHDVAKAARHVAERFDATRVGVFGEVFGSGVQDLSYGTNAGVVPGFAVFDVFVDGPDQARWLDQDEMRSVLDGHLPVVPLLYDGPFDEAVLTTLAEGTETVSGTGAHIREGVVVRAEPDRRSDVLGGRAVTKFVGEGYLLRKGGTEFE